MKTQTSDFHASWFCNALIAMTLMLGSLSSQARAGDNVGQGQILQGTVGAGDGHTVTITVTPQNGAPKNFTVDVTAGETSAQVAAALAAKVDADPDFSGGSSLFHFGDPQQTVDTVNVRSLNGGFQIKSVRVNPDDSGLKNFGGTIGTGVQPNEHSYLLMPHGLPLPGQVEFSAILGNSTTTIAEATVFVANGTSVGTILNDISGQLTSEGVSNEVNGDMLTLDTSLGETFLIGGFATGDLTSIAYDQVISGFAAPEPSSLLLLGSGILGLAALLRKRMIT